MKTREGTIPIFQWRRVDNSIEEGVDVHGLTTTDERCCTNATDTPTPMVVAILRSTTTHP
jgi:hypothetical protein